MRVDKIIRKGIGEIVRPSQNEVKYILNNHISAAKLERIPDRDLFTGGENRLVDERQNQVSFSILKTANDMYNSIINISI